MPARSGLRSRSFASDFLKFKRLTLPQQNNSSDCGCFLLTYIQVRASSLEAPRAGFVRKSAHLSPVPRAVQHFLDCVPDQLSFEQLSSLDKGKGIKLPRCADFLGEHWCARQRAAPAQRGGA